MKPAVDKIFHAYFHSILKEYYHGMSPEYTMTYFAMPETIRLHNEILNKKKGQEFLLFNNVTEGFKNLYPYAAFYFIEDKKPSLTLTFEMPGLEKDNLKVYFSLSLLGPVYCLFLESSGKSGKNLYFEPTFKYVALVKGLIELAENILPDHINMPYYLLAYSLRFIVPGKSQSSTENGLPTSKASLFDALFFDYVLIKVDLSLSIQPV